MDQLRDLGSGQPGVNFTSISTSSLVIQSDTNGFFTLTVCVSFFEKGNMQKAISKMLVKLTSLGSSFTPVEQRWEGNL
jgi:hypothetical protein